MNIFALVSLITALVFVNLGNLIYYKDTKNAANQLMAVFCLVFAYYSFCEFGYRQTRFEEIARLAYNISVFRLLAVAFLLHFILVYTKMPLTGKKRLIYILIYGPALAFPVIDLATEWITAGMVLRYWGWYHIYANSLAVYFYKTWFVIIYAVSAFLCFRYYFRVTGKRLKTQSLYISVAVVIPLLVNLITGEDAIIPFLAKTPDLVTTAALFGGVLVIFAIVKYGFFRLSPAMAAENILSTMSDALLLVNSEGKIEMTNESAASLLGCQKNELIGRTIKELIPDGKPSVYIGGKIAEIKELVSDFKTYRGNLVPVSISTSLLRDEGGETQGVVCIARDLTFRMQVEGQLQEKNRQLEAANRAKSDFLATMSHELRTPLNAVIGFSELMLDGATGDINKEQKNCLDDILASGQQLLTLVSDVLDLSRVESGRTDLFLESVNMSKVIDSAVQIMTIQLNDHGHKLNVNIGDITAVKADGRRVRQIILNLLSNAIKFTPAGGVIRIEAEKKDNYCLVSVIDNGVGIPEKDRERIFEAFVQLGYAMDGAKKGAGLGLAICRGLVEAQGGRIWVESEEGKGSKFIFTLPVYRE